MTAGIASNPQSATRRQLILGLREEELRLPAGRLLSRIPWDGGTLEPSQTSAAQFLNALVRG